MRGIACLGLLAACVHLTLPSNDPTGTLAGIDFTRNRGHTDHVAHVGETRLFPRVGLDLWRVPAETLFRRLTPSELERLPQDVRTHTGVFPKDTHFVSGYPADRPLVMNYAHLPRCYPPGVFLVGAPSALLYHYGLISFSASNRLFIALLVFAWFIGVWAWTAPWREQAPSILRQLLTVFVAGYCWYWAMEGFYDVFSVGVASLGFEATRKQKHGLACICAGLAILIHPRLLMIGPLYAVTFIAAARAFRTLSPGARSGMALGAVLFAAGVAFALWIQSTVVQHAVGQAASVVHPGREPLAIMVAYAMIIVGLAALLYKRGYRLDAAVLLCAGLAFSSQRYLKPWYWLPMLPWAMASIHHARASERFTLPSLAAVARVSVVVMFYFSCISSRWFP